MMRMMGSWRWASRARKGTAALEFCLASPLLLTLFLGGVEVSHYISIVGRMNWATEVIADQISQMASVTTTALGNLGGAAQNIMRPYSGDANTMAIGATTYVISGSTAAIEPSWKKVQTLQGNLTNVVVPNASDLQNSVYPLIDSGGSVIYVTVAYNYTPITALGGFNVVLNYHIFMRPRLQAIVTCSNCSS